MNTLVFLLRSEYRHSAEARTTARPHRTVSPQAGGTEENRGNINMALRLFSRKSMWRFTLQRQVLASAITTRLNAAVVN